MIRLKKQEKIIVKIPDQLYKKIQADLDQKHELANERIGFVYSSYKQVQRHTHLIIFSDYTSVNDENYIKDETVGGRISSAGIRNAININLKSKSGGFSVHKHIENGIPSFSPTDLSELPFITQTFITIFPRQAHGILLFSNNKVTCLVWLPGKKNPHYATKCVVVGDPLNLSFRQPMRAKASNRYSRQTFLGSDSQRLIQNTKIGIVGLGGGGSHVAQQLAYLGFTNLSLIDDDHVDETNLNRLVGATAKDVRRKRRKILVAKRVIKKVLPYSNVQTSKKKWQESRSMLEDCDVIFGCLDSYVARRDLESFCRRHIIPYIDIGMVVNKFETGFFMVGQVICSMPGSPCMQCLGFINETALSEEAKRYGDAGDQPQVVWANGVLASTAVGIVVNLIAGWSKNHSSCYYLSYDGNKHLVIEHPRLKVNGKINCKHYLLEKAGNFKTK